MNRWHIIVALLCSPERESRRLAALLADWPHVARKHELPDGCRRRTRQFQPHPGPKVGVPPSAAAPNAPKGGRAVVPH